MCESGIEIGVEDINISRFYTITAIKEKFDWYKYQIFDFVYRYLTSTINVIKNFFLCRFYKNKGEHDTSIQLVKKLFWYSIPDVNDV